MSSYGKDVRFTAFAWPDGEMMGTRQTAIRQVRSPPAPSLHSLPPRALLRLPPLALRRTLTRNAHA